MSKGKKVLLWGVGILLALGIIGGFIDDDTENDKATDVGVLKQIDIADLEYTTFFTMPNEEDIATALSALNDVSDISVKTDGVSFAYSGNSCNINTYEYASKAEEAANKLSKDDVADYVAYGDKLLIQLSDGLDEAEQEKFFEQVLACLSNEPQTIDDEEDVQAAENESEESTAEFKASEENAKSVGKVASYSNSAYAIINNNNPSFTDSEKKDTTTFEKYSNLDSLGRCGTAYANICNETMPTVNRGSIGSVKPTGWHTVKYDNVDGKYLYNRCHLIGYQLAGENANVKNLITGTRYLNVTGMLPFENMVADYVQETNNHVLYRVTPNFEGKNLVASGVQIEAWSVEDNGEGICFNVYCYNVQPGIIIDYATGESSIDSNYSAVTARDKIDSSSTLQSSGGGNASSTGETASSTQQNVTPAPEPSPQPEVSTTANYVLNTNTRKFHYPGCSDVSRIKTENRADVNSSRDDLIGQGYSPCGHCNP